MQLSVAAREKMGEHSGPATRTLARVSTDQRLSIAVLMALTPRFSVLLR
jgi:hypothetical protein